MYGISIITDRFKKEMLRILTYGVRLWDHMLVFDGAPLLQLCSPKSFSAQPMGVILTTTTCQFMQKVVRYLGVA